MSRGERRETGAGRQMIDLNGLEAYRNGIYLCSGWVPGPRSGYCGWPPSTTATRLMILWTITTWTLTRRAKSGTNSVIALPIGPVANEVAMRAVLAPKLFLRPGT